MSPKANEAYRRIQKTFDIHVSGLSPAEYLEVIEEVLGHVSSCQDCLRDEHPELFE